MKTNNNAAALDIPSNITVKIITMNNNQCHTEQSFLRSHQLLSYSFSSLSSTQKVSSFLFSPQPNRPNFFSPFTFCSHVYSSLNNTAITAHMFSALQTQCWHTKMRDKQGETLKNQAIPNQTYWSDIGTNNTWWRSNLTNPILNYIIKFEQPNKNDNINTNPTLSCLYQTGTTKTLT